MVTRTRTQVAIIGAGPAGLTLSHLLDRAGIESVVLESRSRDYVESRIRAGVLEQNTVELFCDMGLADRLNREGMRHRGVELRFDGTGHRIDFEQLAGRSIWVYGQQEIVKDLIEARVTAGPPLLFEAQAIAIENLGSSKPTVRYRCDGDDCQIDCDFVAGCDGFHGISRRAIPARQLREFIHDYPFSWLGILAAVAPSATELIYASHDRGFALHSMRSPEVSRLYLQCTPGDDIADWTDHRIWNEMHNRFANSDGWELKEGPIIEKAITPMRSYVVEPMQYGNLYLAGDAAHIVPPTGAKGLNLAVSDVRVLARGLIDFYRTGNNDGLDSYTDACLGRVWKVMHFSWWLTSMMHIFSDDSDGTRRRLQLAYLDYLTSSRAAATSFAEQYTGLPFS